jgi:hypothetical protein
VPICAAIVTQFVTHIWSDLSTPSESLWKALGESDAEAACWVHGLTASVSEQNLCLGMPASVASGTCAASLMSAAVRGSLADSLAEMNRCTSLHGCNRSYLGAGVRRTRVGFRPGISRQLRGAASLVAT